MTIQTMRASADGIIQGLRVVGFHGQLGIDQTPARRAPVIADFHGKLARILSCEPDDEGGYALEVEIAASPIDEEVWSSTGTRIDPPWPATLGAVVAIIGRREVELVDELLPRADAPEVIRFLRWIKTNIERSRELRCCRVGDLIAWYGNVSTITALQRLVAEQVRVRVVGDARKKDSKALLQTSFWLSRAAVDEEDVVLAVAGLRLAGSPHWEVVLDAGIRTGTISRRRMRVDEAMANLQSESTARPSAATRSRLAREHVRRSMAGLSSVRIESRRVA